MENRFNLLTSKEWLPFQKSWSIVDSDDMLLREILRFFTLPTLQTTSVFYQGPMNSAFDEIASALGLTAVDDPKRSIQFAIVDLREAIRSCPSPAELLELRNRFAELVQQISSSLIDRRFICVLSSNTHFDGTLVPFAWDLGKVLANNFSLKDEKILCRNRQQSVEISGQSIDYALFARKDDTPRLVTQPDWSLEAFLGRSADPGRSFDLPQWFVLKPPSRKKGEILHPAKYPESLAEKFIKTYSNIGDNVLDPMSGTGSTQLAAISNGRNGFGTELSPFFAELANSRLAEFCNPAQGQLFEAESNKGIYRIEQADARELGMLSFPEISYACTSPPYWDMLNMKGAENQARRIEQGLQTNYSNDEFDVGNISDYTKFLDELTAIYLGMFQLMKKGSYFTFVVKNIKKQGFAYPFAWDLTFRLLPAASPIAEHYWLQDDLSIAPYGYGNTWVSNTFHQYCITVQLSV